MNHTATFVEAVVGVLTGNRFPVPLHEPSFSQREHQLLHDCLDSGFVSSVGEYVDQFEHELATYLGAKHVVAVVNGTAALHIALQLAGVEAGDEVLIPSLSFVATANAVSYCNAIPHFVDSDPASLGIELDQLQSYLSEILQREGDHWVNKTTGRRVVAIVPMHTFGHAGDMDGLLALAERFNLKVVEDAAEALGSRYKGRALGSLGTIGAISFNGNKIITSGGGGAIVTDDPDLAARAKHLTTTAKLAHRWEIAHDEVGYNYRLPNLNAALGCAQLESLDQFIADKSQLAARYRAAFKDLPGVRFVEDVGESEGNHWLNAVVLDESIYVLDEVLSALHDAGILARPAWTLLHSLPMYESCPRMKLEQAERLSRQLICLPSSAFLIGGAADA